MAVLFANNAGGILNANITATQTSIVMQANNGLVFPAITGSNFFYATIYNSGGTFEIVKVTARSGDTLTVVRAQEGTAGFAFSAGDKIDNRITAAALANKVDADTGTAPFATSASACTGNAASATTSGSCTGNSATATSAAYLTTARTIAITGSVIYTSPAFDGSGNVSAAATLSATGASAGTYTVPSVTVNTEGRITAISSGAVPAATTSVAGISQLATGAQVIAGTSTTLAVTPSSLTSQMVIASPGYYTIPGGLIDQFGLSGSIGSNSSTTVTLPKALSAAPLNVQLTARGSGGSTGQSYAYVFAESATQFSIFNAANQSVSFYWRAIGK